MPVRGPRIPMTWWVLRTLAQIQPARAVELARELDVPTARLGHPITNLREMGFVEAVMPKRGNARPGAYGYRVTPLGERHLQMLVVEVRAWLGIDSTSEAPA